MSPHGRLLPGAGGITRPISADGAARLNGRFRDDNRLPGRYRGASDPHQWGNGSAHPQEVPAFRHLLIASVARLRSQVRPACQHVSPNLPDVAGALCGIVYTRPCRRIFTRRYGSRMLRHFWAAARRLTIETDLKNGFQRLSFPSRTMGIRPTCAAMRARWPVRARIFSS